MKKKNVRRIRVARVIVHIIFVDREKENLENILMNRTFVDFAFLGTNNMRYTADVYCNVTDHCKTFFY